MRISLTPQVALLGLVLTLPLSACDETAGFSGDAETAINDAQIARESGDYETAVRILDEAHQQDPNDGAVRSEYAATLLERDGLDVLDVERIATFLSDAVEAQTQARTTARGACAPPEGAVEISMDEVYEMDALRSEAALASVLAAHGYLDPVIPDELKTFDICTDVVDGALVYERDEAIASVRSRLGAFGRIDAAARVAFSSFALTEFLSAYHEVTTLPVEAAWYRLPDGGIYICASTDADAETLQAQGEGILGKIGTSLLALDARAALGGSREIVDAALDGYEAAKDGIGEYCTAR